MLSCEITNPPGDQNGPHWDIVGLMRRSAIFSLHKGLFVDRSINGIFPPGRHDG